MTPPSTKTSETALSSGIIATGYVKRHGTRQQILDNGPGGIPIVEIQRRQVMTADVHVVCGPACSGKTTRMQEILLERARRAPGVENPMTRLEYMADPGAARKPRRAPIFRPILSSVRCPADSSSGDSAFA